jgi:hypothetical protein
MCFFYHFYQTLSRVRVLSRFLPVQLCQADVLDGDRCRNLLSTGQASRPVPRKTFFYPVQDLLEIRQLQWTLKDYFCDLC